MHTVGETPMRTGITSRISARLFDRDPRVAAAALALAMLGLAACGGDGGGNGSGVTGTINVHLTDPPTCKAPNGDFDAVWVTVTRVEAHHSGGAGSGGSGWVDLVDRTLDPMQVDLLSLADPNCLLTLLGSKTGLPAGKYQQIRIHLLSNTPAGGVVVPIPNECAGTGGYNCVDSVTNGLQILLLSSQDKTGIKIPPGQIAGGGLVLEEDLPADISIDFDACDSIVLQGNGQYRLKPTLHAGEVSINQDGISGTVVDATTGLPVPVGSIFVYAEQRDASGTDRVIQRTTADSNDGSFLLCPLAPGLYDLVVAGESGAGVAYAATVTLDVPSGTALGNVPVHATGGSPNGPGEIAGDVTTTDSTATATSADVAVTAMQWLIPPVGTPFFVAIPTFAASIANVATEAQVTCPAGTACASYSLFVPPQNPAVGVFDAGGTTWSTPAGGAAAYTVEAAATIPGGTGDPNCSPSTLVADQDTIGDPLEVSPSATTTAETLSFTDCAPEP
jgi:hypothetical protein